jgi:hypothetical protein
MTRQTKRTVLAVGSLLAIQVISDDCFVRARQARDGQAFTPAVGTGRISGVVIAAGDDTRQPIRRAIVTITGTGLATPRQVVTDDAGKFAFVNLPAGRFSMTAEKPAYLKTHYGNRTPGRAPGMPIALAAGQQLDTVIIPIARGAALGGRVTDQTGAPMAASQIHLRYVTVVNGERKLVSPPAGASWVVTDDRGIYRAYGLMPGDYIVQSVAGGGGFSGQTRVMTPEEIAAATSRNVTAPAPGLRPLVRMATYYPNAIDVANAQPVTLALGDDRADVDIVRVFGHSTSARVSGVAIGPDGQPITNMSVGIVNLSTNSMWASPGIVRANPDGSFTAGTLAPGRWLLFGGAGASDGPANLMPWRTETEIIVGEQPLTGVVLKFERGVNVRGRIVFQGTAALPSPAQVRVSLQPEAVLLDAAPYPQPTTLRTDGTFVVENVAAGKYRVNVRTTGAWAMHSAMAGGRDTLDVPLEVLPGQDASLTVTMTDRPSEITGILFDQLNRPAPEYSVVVFSADRALWTTSPRRSSGVVKLTAEGRYVVTGLPPGDYLLCVLTDVDPRQLGDPAFLEQLATTGVRVTLSEGEKKEQNLKIGG